MKINLLITKLQNLENLSSTETTFLFTEIFSGKVCENELEKILKFLAEKGETVQEISAAAKVMKNFAIPVEISGKSGKKVEIFDVCGTGGSGNAKTFNLSTTVAFVMAAGGVKTAKHGNRKASSQSGSADVLEALNIEISLDPKKMQENLETKNMSFLFAQVLHPAMKYVMPVRKKLAIRTIFNFMGPLTNPAHTQKQLVGVSEKSLVLPMAQILKKLGKKSAMVVYGEDGLDEITLTGKTYYAKFLENPENSNSSEIITGEISPEDFGFKTVSHSEISGGNPEKNAEIILGIFSG
ncbi:TPA: anthranilate phosphoribosyltransferase, partial [Candidatus Peregrinibacteria bacterium]|nr:anthranilate phosphoribosyltransferase [Candidatus Peregrinibacteria bacterium]